MKTIATEETKELLDRMPAADKEAERAVLGSVFYDPDILDDLCLILSPADFYEQIHGEIFALMLELHNAGKKIDLVTFMTAVKKKGKLEVFGGMSYMAEVIDLVGSSANAVHYAEIVRDEAIKRELGRAGEGIIRLAYDHGMDSRDALNQSEGIIFSIRDRRSVSTSQAATVAEVLQRSFAALDGRIAGTIQVGISSGFPELDNLMQFHKSELLILAARPSMGKTALALNIAVNAAVEYRHSVLFFSLEMSALTVGDRLLSAWSEVDGHRMRAGQLAPDDRKKLVKACAEISESKLTIDDSPRLTIQEIAAISRRQKRRKGLDLVVVDYLQLIQAENSRDPREQQVARISSRLKGLARELEVPVLCLAQLNRQVDNAKDNKPRLSHLRESGAIEQDADVVAFVHRPEYFITDPIEKPKWKGKANVLVEKNRNGPTGIANLVWFEQYTRFSSAARGQSWDEVVF
jgi:replicative DNA helicase